MLIGSHSAYILVEILNWNNKHHIWTELQLHKLFSFQSNMQSTELSGADYK